MNITYNNSIPWVEKYRPTQIENIILDPINKQILTNIIHSCYFPNLLFYGPPGTGKTTTIINLVNSYQEKVNQINKGLIIHLNASDERGIDIIRNQINQFVNSKSLFKDGMKFVILDEVDYMTKNAQQALRYLLQNYSSGVRFCLICNYISKIDEGLQNDFLKLRFNQLPENDIFLFLNNIVQNEHLHLNETSVRLIQQLFKSDIRSMINFMQTNQNIQYNHIHIIEPNVWETLLSMMILKEDSAHLLHHVHEISINYNIDKKNIMKDFLNYIIRKKQHIVTTPFLNFIENVIHFEDCSNEDYVNYTIIKIKKYLNQE